MLLSFGAEHSIPLDDATREKIQQVDLSEVRVMVKKERVRACVRACVYLGLTPAHVFVCTDHTPRPLSPHDDHHQR